MKIDGKPKFYDCPVCGAGGIIPDENGKCTHCGAVIAEKQKEYTTSEAKSIEKDNSYNNSSTSMEDEIKEKPAIKASSGKNNSNAKTPLSVRFLRSLCIIWFVVTTLICTVAICSVNNRLGMSVVLLLFSVLSILLSTFLIRRFSPRISEQETPSNFNGWLIVISIASIVVWGEATTITIPSFVIFIAFILGFFGAIGVLFKSRFFYLRNYVIASLAIVSCLVSILYPALLKANSTAQASIRTRAFSDIIAECEKLASLTDFNIGLNQTVALNQISDIQNSTLVLMNDDKSHLRRLQVAYLEYYISKQFLVPIHKSPKLILIIGPAEISSSYATGNTIIKASFNRSVMFYSWPEKKYIRSDTITATYKRRSSTSDLWGDMFVNRQFGAELERIITATDSQQ